MAITTAQIKELREATGAGILDCKDALKNADGDYEKAVDFLREKGLAKAAKRSDRTAGEGVIELYSHGGGRVGVMVELNCETDFVGLSDAFRTLAHELALQIAASSPLWVSEEDVPEEILEREAAVAKAQALEEGKPEAILDKIVDGRLKKFKEENCLLLQGYIREDKQTIQDLLNANIASMGEKVVIRRFERWELGEAAE